MTYPFADWKDRLDALCREAGAAIMTFTEHHGARAKADGSPVTLADAAAEKILLAGLVPLGLPVVAEEQADADPETLNVAGAAYWLVDPLDGTKEFIAGGTDFTVNIGLIVDQVPVFGIVHLPATGASYLGVVGEGAERRTAPGPGEAIAMRAMPDAGATVIASRRHDSAAAVDALLAARGLTMAERIQAGSSMKFCRLAEGAADLYPRHGPTMEWDTAAGHAVLLAAGGRVETLAGAPLAYGKPERRNPGFIALAG